MNKKIYIGFDSREAIASQVCEFSLKENSNTELDIEHIKINEMRKKNIYKRDNDKLGSTEFTFTRFLIPHLENYNGWALFCDSDFLWLSDVNELFSLCDDKYAVMCVHHDYKPINDQKNWGSTTSLSQKKLEFYGPMELFAPKQQNCNT